MILIYFSESLVWGKNILQSNYYREYVGIKIQ